MTDPNLLRLDFDFKNLFLNFIDKRTGLLLHLGFVYGLSGIYADFSDRNNGFAICIESKAQPQDELDRECTRLQQDAQSNPDLKLLITKNSYPFDNRWFLTGDFIKMGELSEKNQISLPFDHLLMKDIIRIFEKYRT